MSKQKYIATLMKRVDGLSKVAKSITLSPADASALSGVLEKRNGKTYYKGTEIREQAPQAKVLREERKS